jgi:hypothetical protein
MQSANGDDEPSFFDPETMLECPARQRTTKMQMPHPLIVCGLLALCSSSPSASADTPQAMTFPAATNGQIVFVMPSARIECIYTPKGGTLLYEPLDGGPELSCDRVEPHYVRVVLTPNKVQRFNNVGDRGCCSAGNVLTYGARWTHDDFTCLSARTGLTCEHKNGHGFVISRSVIKVH